ncbi:ferritin-like superfamily [Aspergillus egyptiacus]|nr:ferritin-like superfamily [Aspergillus egyptiacus]
MVEEAKKIIAEVSDQNLDEWVRIKSMTPELEESIRGHIHQELTSWMFFRKLRSDCSRSNIALHGFAQLWERSAAECLLDYHWLEKYLSSRGGRAKPTAIEAPQIEWPDNPIEPVGPCKEALLVEKRLLEDLERLASLAEKCGDNSLQDAIESRFLRKEVKHVKDLGDLLQQVVRVSKQPGLGIYLLDKELRAHGGSVPWGDMNNPDRHDERVKEVTSSLKGELSL